MTLKFDKTDFLLTTRSKDMSIAPQTAAKKAREYLEGEN